MAKIRGCPITNRILLQQRLIELMNAQIRVSVRLPGQTLSGQISNVGQSFVVIDNTRINFNEPFAIQHLEPVQFEFFRVFIKVPGLGRLIDVQLMQRGIDFIEVFQDKPEGQFVFTIVPLNAFVSVRCEEFDPFDGAEE